MSGKFDFEFKNRLMFTLIPLYFNSSFRRKFGNKKLFFKHIV